MLREQDRMDPGEGSFGSQGKTTKPEIEPKMEIIKFVLEFTVLTIAIPAVAALVVLRGSRRAKRETII